MSTCTANGPFEPPKNDALADKKANGDPAFALCQYGSDFDYAYECPCCYRAPQSRYDRLREIADSAINLISTDSLSDRSSVDSLRRQLAALDGEVR